VTTYDNRFIGNELQRAAQAYELRCHAEPHAFHAALALYAGADADKPLAVVEALMVEAAGLDDGWDEG
jgi:hypothetical protein